MTTKINNTIEENTQNINKYVVSNLYKYCKFAEKFLFSNTFRVFALSWIFINIYYFSIIIYISYAKINNIEISNNISNHLIWPLLALFNIMIQNYGKINNELDNIDDTNFTIKSTDNTSSNNVLSKKRLKIELFIYPVIYLIYLLIIVLGKYNFEYKEQSLIDGAVIGVFYLVAVLVTNRNSNNENYELSNYFKEIHRKIVIFTGISIYIAIFVIFPLSFYFMSKDGNSGPILFIVACCIFTFLGPFLGIIYDLFFRKKDLQNIVNKN